MMVSSGSDGIAQKIIRNTKFNLIGNIWGAVITLSVTPYIIGHVGIERFGIWAIVGVITGYFGLLDFGIGTSFVKYIAEFYAKKDYEKINHIVNTGFVFYLMLTVVIVALFLIFTIPILGFFKIPSYLYAEAGPVFFIGIMLFGASNILSPFGAIQTGLQRMDISNKISIALSIPSVAGIIIVLEKGYGLRGLMVNNAIIFIISSVANICLAYKILPSLRFNPFSFDIHTFYKVLNFGYKIQIAKVSGWITNQTDKVLIANFLSIGLVTFYQLGNTIVGYMISVSSMMVSALMPAFSEIEAGGARKRLIDAYLRSTKYMSFFVFPIFVFCIISAFSIMTAWMGPGYEKSSYIIQILAVAFLINSISQIAASTCMAINKPQFMAAGSAIIISLNIILSIILIKKFGFLGAAWGTMLSVNIGTIYFLAILHKNLQISLKELFTVTVPYMLCAAVAAFMVMSIDMIVKQINIPIGRFADIGLLFVRGLIFSFVYIGAVYFGRFFDRSDMDLLRNIYRHALE